MNKPTAFNLKIELGNDAMQHTSDIAEALRRVAMKVDNGFRSGVIYDVCGNIVGHFTLE